MYKTNQLGFAHALAHLPPRMPIDILLALPDYVTGPETVSHLFNLPGAINDLMGGSGWESAVKVMKPYIWAPQWNDEDLYKFASAPFGRDKHPFPKLDPQELRPNQQEFEIVHIIGSISVQEDEFPSLDLGCETSPPSLSAKTLLELLPSMGTRLLILQNPVFLNEVSPDAYSKRAAQLAESIIAKGGRPPVLVITDKETDAALWVELFLGEGGDEMLLISGHQPVPALPRMIHQKSAKSSANTQRSHAISKVRMRNDRLW